MASMDFVIHRYDIRYEEKGRDMRHWWPYRFIVNGKVVFQDEFHEKMAIAQAQPVSKCSRSLSYRTHFIDLDERREI